MAVKTKLGDKTNVGNVELFLDTAYDKVKRVSENIEELLDLEEHFKNLDGNYLGTSAIELTLRPDSSSLQDGDGYFNTTLNLYYVYVDGSWIHQTIFYDQDALESAVGAGPFNVWIAYADDASGTNISTVPSASKKYIGIANNRETSTVDISNPGIFSWYYAEGPTGPEGNIGPAGPTTYLHIAYANSADGAINFNFIGGTHIGLLSNTNATQSTDFHDYTWTTVSVVKGDPGNDGADAVIVVNSPTIPTNIQAVTTSSSVKITWDAPSYSGHWYTKIYKTTWDGLTYPTFSEAFLVSSVQGDFIDLNVTSNTQYLYWVKHVNTNAAEGPRAGGNGLEAATGLSYADEQEWINEGNFDPSLANRIDIIDSSLLSSGDGGLQAAFTALDTSVSGLSTSLGTVSATGQATISSLQSLDDDFRALSAVVGDENAGLFYEVGLNTTSAAGNTAAIAQNLTSIGGLRAQYTVKINNNGHVAGFGLASTTSPYNNAVHSEFAVLADKFIIAHPNSTETYPFVVDGSNVFIDSLFVKESSITRAKISDTIESDNWNPATKQGMKLDFANGTMQGNGVAIYNGAGQLIFGSGTSINVNSDGSISGVPTSGAPNISSISGAGNMAEIDSITTGNRSRYLSSKVITGTYIADLTVDTIKVTSGAITNMNFQVTNPNITLSTSWSSSGSLYVSGYNSNTDKVIVIGSATVEMNGTFCDCNIEIGNSAGWKNAGYLKGNGLAGSSSNARFVHASTAVTFTSGTGPYKMRLQKNNSGGSTIVYRQCRLAVLVGKR